MSTARPVALSELVEQKSMLQVEGRTPPPINVSLRLPPDLFTWQSRGIPMDLNYRYSPPAADHSGSRLTLSINDQFIEAFNLTTKGQGGESNRVRVPLLDDSILSGDALVRIPAFKVGSKNQIEFEFGFASVTDGQCQVTQPSKQYAVIDGDSTVDFSGFLTTSKCQICALLLLLVSLTLAWPICQKLRLLFQRELQKKCCRPS